MENEKDIVRICVEKNLFDKDQEEISIENFGSIAPGTSSSLSTSIGSFSTLSSSQGNLSSLSTTVGNVSTLNPAPSPDVVITSGQSAQQSTTTRLINYSKTNFGTDQIVFDIGLSNLTSVSFLEALRMINLEGNNQYVENNALIATQDDIECTFTDDLLSSFPLTTPLQTVIDLIENEVTTVDNVNLTVSSILQLFTEYNNASTTTTRVDTTAVANALSDNQLTALEIAAIFASDDLLEIDGDEQELQEEELLSSGSITMSGGGGSSGEVTISVSAQAARERARALLDPKDFATPTFPRDNIELGATYETASIPIPRTQLPGTGYSKESLQILKKLPVEALPEILKNLPQDDLISRTQVRLIQVMRWSPEPLITVSDNKIAVSDQFLLVMPPELLWQMIQDVPQNDRQTRGRINKILRAKGVVLPSKKAVRKSLPSRTKPKTQTKKLAKPKPLPPVIAARKMGPALSESKTIPLSFSKLPTVRSGAPWDCNIKENLSLLKKQALPGEDENVGVIETPYTFEEIEATFFQKEYEKLFVSLLKIGGSLCSLKSKKVKWDDKKNKQLLELIAKNTDIEEIAAAFNSDTGEIQKRLKELNYEVVDFDLTKKLNIFEKNRDIIYRRFQYFLKNNIIELRSPDTNLVDAMVQRDFIIKKITISFSPVQDIEWSPLLKLEGTRDIEGKVNPLDPIEYQIRKMSYENAIKTVVKKRLQDLLDMQFEFVEEKEEYDPMTSAVVRVGFNRNKGTGSLIGMDNFFSVGKQTMNFAWLDSPTIIHEFCHVLGLIHEHQNPLGKNIDWNDEKVYAWAKNVYGWDREETYINIIQKYDIDQVNSTDYDYQSVMLYFFPPQLTKDGLGTQQNLRFSMEDIKFLVSVLPPREMDYKQFYDKIYKDMGGEEDDDDSLYDYITSWDFFTWILVILVLAGMFALYRKYRSQNN